MPTQVDIVVKHEVGLHARPAAVFVRTAKGFAARIHICNATMGTPPVNAKSILGVLTLGVQQGHQVHLEAEGVDAEAALAALRTLIENNFA